MVLFFSSNRQEDPLDDFGLKRNAVKSFRDAMRRHNSALKDLEVSMRTCVKTMEAVAISLHNLSTDAQVVPVATHVTGALRRGLAGIVGEKDSKGGGPQWDALQDEIEYSVKERFTAVHEAHKGLDDCRKRRSKAKKELDSAQAECDRLMKRGNGPTSAPAGDPSRSSAATRTVAAAACTAYEAALHKKESREVEFHRLHSEFEDEYAKFVAKLGAAVQDDVRGVTEVVHGVLTAVSYQFRKCTENVSRRATTTATTVGADAS